jgi:hypothetical protein
MMMKNFELFDDRLAIRRIKQILMALAVLVVIYLLLPLELPGRIEKVLPIAYTLIIYQYTVKLQGANLQKHFLGGGVKYSWWRVLGVSIIALLVMLAYFFVVLSMIKILAL